MDMPRETIAELRKKISALEAENDLLRKDKREYFDRMTNAELFAEKWKRRAEELESELATVRANTVTAQEISADIPPTLRRGRPARITEEQ